MYALQDLHEDGRGNKSHLGIAPSGKSLPSTHLTCKCPDLRLIIYLKVFFLESLLEIIYNVLPELISLIELIIVEIVILIINPDDVVAGNLSPVHHFNGILFIAG